MYHIVHSQMHHRGQRNLTLVALATVVTEVDCLGSCRKNKKDKMARSEEFRNVTEHFSHTFITKCNSNILLFRCVFCVMLPAKFCRGRWLGLHRGAS